MAKMTREVMDLLNERPLVPKVLSTCDARGTLNAVPKETLSAVDEETIAFADIWGDKTNVNLKANSKTAVAVFKIEVPPVGYQIKGTFRGFQTSGPLFDTFAKAVKEMLNLDIKAVGVIKVEEVYSAAPPNPGAKIA
jgi:predicted pyridoxine 5'-phosphate oxidase superfamily flavin-nucleotide-binding protein